MNTPNHASDEQIAELRALEHEVVYLRSIPIEDWQIDINEDGAMIGVCPRCAGRDVNAVTPERMHCNACGHTDGTEYVRIGATREDPGENVPRAYIDPDA